MASEDVIELGSSDDETEPAPKKTKPMPNAMVCIPRKFHDVTIKPTKPNLVKQIKGKLGKGVTVTKTVANPFADKTKTNGIPVLKPVQRPIQRPAMKPHLKLVKPISIQKSCVTNINQQTNHPMLKVADTNKFMNKKFLSSAIKMQTPKTINSLPPSITIKKTTKPTEKPIIIMNVSKLKPKPNMTQITEVPTVELDDDEGSPSSSSPVWYLRPEEQTETLSMETENNEEPEQPKMIEITIEDSPVKPHNKRTHEIGAELAITIDDSPIKATAEKAESASGSDTEEVSRKERNSKKQLKYPKDSNNDQMEIEIEIQLEQDTVKNNTGADNNASEQANVGSEKKNSEPSEVIDVTEKSVQKKTEAAVSKESDKVLVSSSTTSEFSPVYQSFIDLCFELENSDDMKKIVEKKIKAYYKQVPKEYTESEEFTDMVSGKILAMKASPDKMYLYIKDIVDELNLQRKLMKSQMVNKETVSEESEQVTSIEESEYDTKRQRQIRKLEKTIKKLHRAIQKLEEQEVDFDDEDDSVYLLTERYKERMVRVYAKFCQMTNTKMPSEPRIQLDARLGRPAGPAKRLEKWINKKVPIGTPLPFPDFHDVLRCVREANEEDKLGWNEADIMEEARDLFTRCGKKLQRRRQENEWRLAASRIALDVDPAEKNEQLKCKLEENRKLAAVKETEIFNKYADRQNQLKLEGEEIGDKEAEESPVESEDEEANDECVSLENTEKRKERLKRLLQERSKRVSVAKESPPAKESPAAEESLPAEECKDIKTDSQESETKQEEKNSEETDVKVDHKTTENQNTEKDQKNAEITETLSVSDDSNGLESDIDELHLLQKLHSGNEAQTSSIESSDSESPIAISDSLESTDSKKHLSDVISIENSSYSESEIDNTVKTTDVDEIIISNKINDLTDHAGMEAKSSEVIETERLSIDTIQDSPDAEIVTETEPLRATTKCEKVRTKSNNDEYNESIEDILLASSEDETIGSQEEGGGERVTDSVCVNLKDDLISIDETVVGNVNDELRKGVEIELNIVIPNKESSKDREKSDDANNVELMETSQNDALTVSRDTSENNVSMVCDNSDVIDTQEKMDVDQDRTVEVVEK